MEYRISYFANLRNFKPHMIPFSTAVYDPKWFSNNGQVYKRNGIYHGLKYYSLVPNERCEGLCRGPKDCFYVGKETCPFLEQYRKQLDELDFSLVTQELENIAMAIKNHEDFEEEPVIVLLVYETPDNPCSERRVLQQWFKDNNKKLEEL